MANLKTPNFQGDIHISTDLSFKTKPYLDLLQHYVSQTPSVWTDSHALKRAIYRYEHFWLPLLSELHDKLDMDPPEDVLWVWHHHMLLIGHYLNYCKARFHRLLPHNVRTTQADIRAAIETAREQWKRKYPDEPFHLDPTTLQDHSRYPSRLGELITVASDQRTFSYQVSLPHYRDRSFITTAVQRYRQFLYAQSLCAGNCRDIPYDIQLIWRVHVLHPQDYLRDLQFMPQLYDPLDYYVEDSLHSDLAVKSKWNQLYTNQFGVNGTCCRGDDMKYISEFPKDKDLQVTIDSCKIRIDDIEVSDKASKTGIRTGDKVYVEIRRIKDSSFSFEKLCTAKGKINERMRVKQGVGQTDFDGQAHRGLEFVITSCSGTMCFKKERAISTLFYSPLKSFENNSFYNRTIPVELPTVMSTDPVVKFTCTVTAQDGKPHALMFERQNFALTQCPQMLKIYLQSELSWVDSFSTSDVGFLHAKHFVRSKAVPLEFECDVVTHEASNNCALLVHVAGHSTKPLVCMAHTIAIEQLPYNDMVSDACNLKVDSADDHAMLIRNHEGDWAVLVGRWLDTEPGHGKVQLTVHNVQQRKTTVFYINEDELKTLKIDYISVDLPTGRMTISPLCIGSVSEQIALAFSAGILFISCQKRAILLAQTPTGSVRSLKAAVDKEVDTSSIGKSKQSTSRIRAQKRKSKKRKMSATFTFLLACGLQMDTYMTSSQPSSRNSSLSKKDTPTVTSQKGDIIFEAPSQQTTVIKANGFLDHKLGHMMMLSSSLVIGAEDDDTQDAVEGVVDVRL